MIELPQIVPSPVCLSCRVCCHFPVRDSVLRPYFTPAEIRAAVGAGIDPTHFPRAQGGQISVVPDPSGHGYLCPAYDPDTSHCRIYAHRPLDCRIYPLAVMWSKDRREIVLGWDSKCPFLPESRGAGHEARGTRQAQSSLRVYADEIADLIEGDEIFETFVAHPGLIGPFQDDVVVVRSLPRLTNRLISRTSGLAARAPRLAPLTLDDRFRLEQAVAGVETTLAAYAFAPHFIWQDVLSYQWAEMHGCFCLFANSPDGLFMPLPPLGPPERLLPAMADSFSFMGRRNGVSAVTRIENLPASLKATCEAAGYHTRPKDPDYLYQTQALVALAGDRYKSQRAACNRFVRTHKVRWESYDTRYADSCLALYRRWAAQQEARGLDQAALHMLKDSESAHRQALAHHAELGLVGRVAWVQDSLCAYSFGFSRSRSVFCVLLEIADRSIPGLAQFVFREMCREADLQGHTFINTMDDSGLPALARSKLQYHPVELVPAYIVTPQ